MIIPIIYVQLLLFILCRGQPLHEKERAEDHFPSIPELPAPHAGFIVVAQNASLHERALLALDMPGQPLTPSEDGTFTPSTYSIGQDQHDALLEGDHFEGDISGIRLASDNLALLTRGEREELIRAAVVNTYQKWPRAEIPYAVSSVFTRSERAVIFEAMKQFEHNSCVR